MIGFILKILQEAANLSARILGPIAFISLLILFIRGIGPQVGLCRSVGEGSAKRTTCARIIVFHGDTWLETLMFWKYELKPIFRKKI